MEILGESEKILIKQKAQVQILYSQSAVTFAFPMLAAVALCFVLWDVAVRQTLLIWLFIVILFAIIRYFILSAFVIVSLPKSAYKPLTFAPKAILMKLS